MHVNLHLFICPCKISMHMQLDLIWSLASRSFLLKKILFIMCSSMDKRKFVHDSVALVNNFTVNFQGIGKISVTANSYRLALTYLVLYCTLNLYIFHAKPRCICAHNLYVSICVHNGLLKPQKKD